jgi:hypothetical protein
VNADWDRSTKALKVTVPPFQWLFTDEQQAAENPQLAAKIQR